MKMIGHYYHLSVYDVLKFFGYLVIPLLNHQTSLIQIQYFVLNISKKHLTILCTHCNKIRPLRRIVVAFQPDAAPVMYVRVIFHICIFYIGADTRVCPYVCLRVSISGQTRGSALTIHRLLSVGAVVVGRSLGRTRVSALTIGYRSSVVRRGRPTCLPLRLSSRLYIWGRHVGLPLQSDIGGRTSGADTWVCPLRVSSRHYAGADSVCCFIVFVFHFYCICGMCFFSAFTMISFLSVFKRRSISLGYSFLDRLNRPETLSCKLFLL